MTTRRRLCHQLPGYWASPHGSPFSLSNKCAIGVRHSRSAVRHIRIYPSFDTKDAADHDLQVPPSDGHGARRAE
ncbi:hypothetical protein G7Z17_g3727 [Cylindrodendrum hubeiense]|uniref:Uncharacterized protein n=1 Tax=Cylindrodendrum hubeiense TaxID=595255 RepID=A0A9P5LDB6_9HYPO|nr:hypothetical protein G7Z17_g3727 [Cylindrodendrum hubeiense]